MKGISNRLVEDMMRAALADGRQVKVTKIDAATLGEGRPARLPVPTTLEVKNEKEFTAEVRSLALGNGWDYYHTHDSRHSDGGFPDCFMIRELPLSAVVAELKFGKNKPTKAQLRWLHLFRLLGIPTYVWYPEDWPEVVTVLSGRKP